MFKLFSAIWSPITVDKHLVVYLLNVPLCVLNCLPVIRFLEHFQLLVVAKYVVGLKQEKKLEKLQAIKLNELQYKTP